MSITEFVQGLKPFLKNGTLSPEIQEEYLHNGILDTKYIEQVLEERTTESKMRAVVNSALGTVSFNIVEVENEVTKEQFIQEYTFANFSNVRGWIGYFHRTKDLVLTKEKLYEYILSGAVN